MYTISIILACVFCHISNAAWSKYMENPSLYEGDIELSGEQIAKLYSGYALTRAGGFYKHWPIGKPIPYYFDNNLIGRDNTFKPLLLKAMKDYESKTCLRFIPRTNEKSYIHFVTGTGCSSYLGMQVTKPNYIRLHDACFKRYGTLLHEIAHSLGVLHEQSRPDRDQYVKIHPENMRCCESQFKKRDSQTIDSLGFPYDYDSMMHYGETAFGNGKGVTIEVLQKGRKIGQRDGFSTIDLKQINKLYKCDPRSCQVNPEDRISCGKGGITKDECTKKGCCFNNRTYGTHWCYYQQTKKSCSVNPENRVECGYAGISQSTCEAKGCCFNNKFSGVKWCYAKN